MSKKTKTPLTYAEFTQELTKVINGHPGADKTIAAFWNDTRAGLRVKTAVVDPAGIEVLKATTTDEEASR